MISRDVRVEVPDVCSCIVPAVTLLLSVKSDLRQLPSLWGVTAVKAIGPVRVKRRLSWEKKRAH